MADAVDHLQGTPNYQVYFILQQPCLIRVHWRSFAVNVQIPSVGFGEPKATVSMPTQFVISYLRLTRGYRLRPLRGRRPKRSFTRIAPLSAPDPEGITAHSRSVEDLRDDTTGSLF